jgi:hypothetical protein
MATDIIVWLFVTTIYLVVDRLCRHRLDLGQGENYPLARTRTEEGIVADVDDVRTELHAKLNVVKSSGFCQIKQWT